MERIAIIMAGGAGNRFWPLSKINRPKQLIQFKEGSPTLLEEAIERALIVFKSENIYIITNQYMLDAIGKVITEIPRENIIAEPAKRNTAPSLALMAAIISVRYKLKGIPESNIVIGVLTADQKIFPNDAFTRSIEALLRYVEFNPVLATIGIRPNRPETGYGYIEIQDEFEDSTSSIQIKPLKSFHEKPTLEVAQRYYLQNRFLWNSGMFFWRLDVFRENMKKYTPEIGNNIQKLQEYLEENPYEIDMTKNKQVLELYASLPDISIDYALMEKAERVVVERAVFTWEDVGTYDALPRIYSVDNSNNYLNGNIETIDTKNSIIINQNNTNDFLIAALGIDNMVVSATEDALLICPKDRVQEIKRIVEKLTREGKTKYL
ncbi:MAG TPA: sugar phosphate nucleotidyltransferase [Candidatus Kapabacteria bacterium]|nr:mannose-1-phosphate guanylyltransferase [Candidatus Kapabacteria bacterium]HOV91585.1 sugar phosphate nucleotidyltransferase [Candidatus Kapabacteria bacterium]